MLQQYLPQMAVKCRRLKILGLVILAHLSMITPLQKHARCAGQRRLALALHSLALELANPSMMSSCDIVRLAGL